MLWDIHTDIVYFNVSVDLGKASSEWLALQEQCRVILINSELLRATFIFAARVCAEGIGALIYDCLRSGRPISETPGFTALFARYRTAITTISTDAKAVFPNSSEVSERIARFLPLDAPVWVTYKDHVGAKVINHVWFPKEFVEPHMRSLALRQAEATRQ